MWKIILKSKYEELVNQADRATTQTLLKEYYRRRCVEQKITIRNAEAKADYVAKVLRRTEILLKREEKANKELSDACVKLSAQIDSNKKPNHECKAVEGWFNPNFTAPCQECGKITNDTSN